MILCCIFNLLFDHHLVYLNMKKDIMRKHNYRHKIILLEYDPIVHILNGFYKNQVSYVQVRNFEETEMIKKLKQSRYRPGVAQRVPES